MELSADEAIAYALRRAVTILERSHHPNIIRMLSATKGNGINYNQVQILFELADVGSLKHVCSMNHTSDYVEMLLAVTCQVLNALLFLHTKLNVAHRSITAENILLDSEGRVKLCGFCATPQSACGPSVIADMRQLSAMLSALLPSQKDITEEHPEESALRAFVEFLKNSTPFEALKHNVMKKYYNEKPNDAEYKALKTELETLQISGKNPIEEIASWRKYDEKNPTGKDRHTIRSKMKELCLRRELAAITIVKSYLRYTEPQVELPPVPISNDAETMSITRSSLP